MPSFGIIGIETRYVTYKDGELVAEELINKPPFFAEFATSIRPEDNANGSTATYKFRFVARPKLLGWLLEPIMLRALKAGTGKRLEALSGFLAEDQKV